ncbi:MAG TPA: chromate resistance protein ChrB domain-containing protein, partial [Nitrososphaeraceae archaeon]|nr:chromate resistance protein ChrB domain-containing protein [Nitrososphaeraceae archaeon]
MKWVTREHAKVDRIACPWLIKNFVDKEAEFLFVPAHKVMDTAKERSAIPFDIPNVDLGHHGEECSFDAIVRKYELEKKEPALLELARIVRGADTPKRSL